jgi:ribosomal protein S27E
LIASTYVRVPRTEKESYQLQKHSVIISETFTVPPTTITHSSYLNGGDLLNIQVTVTSGGNKDIDFRVNYGTTTYLSYSRATTVNRDWTVPSSGNYNFVYDNSFSWITSKDVNVQVTKSWTETAWRDVAKSYPAFPSQLMYVGIVVLVISGVPASILLVVAGKNAYRRSQIEQLAKKEKKREMQQKMEEQKRERVAQEKLQMQQYIENARRERLEKARNLETSGRFEEAAGIYDELEMYEKAGECRRMTKTSYQISTSFIMGKDGAISCKCPTCGSSQTLESKSNLVTCKHCGNNYVISKKVLDML